MRSFNSLNQLIITTAKDQIWWFIVLKSSYFNECCLMLILFVKFLINVFYKCLSTKANVNLIQWNMKEKHLLWRQWLLTREFHLKLLVTSWLASVNALTLINLSLPIFKITSRYNYLRLSETSYSLFIWWYSAINSAGWLNKISVCSFPIATHFVSIEEVFLTFSKNFFHRKDTQYPLLLSFVKTDATCIKFHQKFSGK